MDERPGDAMEVWDVRKDDAKEKPTLVCVGCGNRVELEAKSTLYCLDCLALAF